MPALTRTDVERVATLARLHLTDTEKELFARQLADILAYADQIRAVDTTAAPDNPADGDRQPLRADRPRPSLDRAVALSQAPDADPQAGLFKVPRVLG